MSDSAGKIENCGCFMAGLFTYCRCTLCSIKVGRNVGFYANVSSPASRSCNNVTHLSCKINFDWDLEMQVSKLRRLVLGVLFDCARKANTICNSCLGKSV